jgi:glycerophosphoryl diester phosphodiesterase
MFNCLLAHNPQSRISLTKSGSLSNHLPTTILTIGHRGFAGKYTENSLQAFEQAVNLGVDGVELDVWVCKTGELVVFHDRTLERLTSGVGKISDYTFSDLRKLKLPNGSQIPTLNEVLQVVNHKCMVNIELKGPDTAAPVANLISEYLKKGWHAKDFMVSSFMHPELQKFHKLMPLIPFGPLTDGVMLNYSQVAQNIGAQYLIINFEYATKALVQDAHAHGLKLLVYTVDDLKDIAHVKALGVDGIISNFPNHLF